LLTIGLSERFVFDVGKAREGYAQRILSGSFSSLEEYKYIAGKLNGLEEAENIFRKIYAEMFDFGVQELELEGIENVEDS
jgi:hypothetical protein